MGFSNVSQVLGTIQTLSDESFRVRTDVAVMQKINISECVFFRVSSARGICSAM